MSAGITPVQIPGQESLSTGQVSVTNTATLIVPARSGRRSVIIVQHGTVDVLLGNSNVTTATGILLAGTKGLVMTLQTAAAVYGIVAAGSQTISYEEEF